MQVGLLVAVLAVSLLVFVRGFVVRRRQIGFRVPLNSPVTGEIESGFPGVLSGLGGSQMPVKELSIVLIRIENIGVTSIEPTDYAMPGRVGLQLCFPQCQVVGMAVAELSDPSLADPLGCYPGIGVREDIHDVGIIDLPKVPMNRGDFYTILAVLRRKSGWSISGSNGAYPEPTLHGKLIGGRVRQVQGTEGQQALGPFRGYVTGARQLWKGLFMSVGVAVLAAATAAGDERGIEIAAVAASSVPVVGAAMVAMSGSELGSLANTDLRRTLLVSQVLAGLAVVGFGVAVVLGIFGLGTEANAVYAALAGGTLGGVSLMVGHRASTARRYALTLEMVNSIEDPHLRDRTRAQIALEVSHRGPVGPPGQGEIEAPADQHRE